MIKKIKLKDNILNVQYISVGRMSHMKLAENFAEVFAEKQGCEIGKRMEEEMRMFNETIYRVVL